MLDSGRAGYCLQFYVGNYGHGGLNSLCRNNLKILVTPLSLTLMPPSMYLFSLGFSSAVRDIAYYSRNSKNCLVVFLSDGNLSFVEFPEPNTWEDLEGRDFNVEISDCKTALASIVHLLWLDVHSLLCVSAYGSCQNKCLSLVSYATELHGSYLQEVKVACYENHVPDQITCSGFEARVTCLTLLKLLICGLDDMGRLYINGKSLCNNCSNFSFYSELANEVVTHLIILTKQDFLFIVDTEDVLQGEVALGNMYFVTDGIRRDEEIMSFVNVWERGAEVIGVLIGDEAAIILQTMRGISNAFILESWSCLPLQMR